MDQASFTLCPVEAVEAKLYQGKADDEVWDIRISGLEIGHKRSWSMVELWSVSYESGFPKEVL